MELGRLSRAIVHQETDFIGPNRDIPAPDVSTNPIIMGWMMDDYSRIRRAQCPAVITGKPSPTSAHFPQGIVGQRTFIN